MIALHFVDVIVVVGYLLGITVLGTWMGRSVKGLSDYFMPRRFGKGMMMMHAFGTGTASDQAVIVASGTFRNGLSGIWFQWLWLFNTPFYWLLAPIFRRCRAITTADVYRLRFDGSVAVLFGIVGIVGLAVKIALMLKGAGALIDAGTDGTVSASWAMPLVALLFVVYGTAGGLNAAILTDYFQGMLTVVFSFLLLPFVMQAVGGIAGMRAAINDPQMLSLVAPEEITIFYVAMFSILSLTGIVAQPFVMGICAAGRTEMDGRFGFVVGNLIKRVCTVAWALTGIAALALFINEGVDLSQVNPDRIYGQMAARFLPHFMPGLVGLFIAALLAGVMSSCDSFMVSAAGLFTENLYKPLVSNKTDAHYLAVGRGFGVLIVAAAVMIAFAMPNVLAGLKTWLMIPSLLGVAFWMGLIWRRFNVAGAWASMIAASFAWWVTTQAWFVELVAALPVAEAYGFIWTAVGKSSIYEPWQILFYLSLAVMSGIVASLITRPPHRDSIERFHELIRTPIGDQEVIEVPCTLPRGMVPASRTMLFVGTDFEIPLPSRVAMAGFFASWLAVATMILGIVWLVRK